MIVSCVHFEDYYAIILAKPLLTLQFKTVEQWFTQNCRIKVW